MPQFLSRAPYDDKPTTPPIWRTEGFCGAFGDAYVRDSGLEGGQTCNSMDMVADILGRLVDQRRDLLSLFRDADLKKLSRISTEFKAGATLDRDQLKTSMRVQSTTSKDTVSQDVEKARDFLLGFVAKLEALKPGERLVIPGGWSSPTGGHAVIYIVFCDSLVDNKPLSPSTATSQDSYCYSFATCNTGDGVNYHPRLDCEYYPKSKHQCAILFRDVPRHRLIESSFWYMLFKMKVRKRVTR